MGYIARYLVALVFIGLVPLTSFAGGDNGFEERVQALHADSFARKAEAIEALAETGHQRAQTVLQAMLESQLFFRIEDRRVVIAKKTSDGYRLTDAATGAALGTVSRWDVRRVVVNNRLRGKLRTALAGLKLDSADPDDRLAAVREMTGNLDAGTRQVLQKAVDEEPNARVREAMETALALARLDSEDPQTRLAAVVEMQDSLRQDVRNKLRTLASQDPSDQVRAAASEAVTAIEGRLRLYGQLETIFFGLSLGSVLVLAAIGLAITFGVMGVINMAHGELIMIGAYTTYVVQKLMPQATDLSLFVAIPMAFLVSGLVGIVIERSVIRFLYGRPLETLLATFGISLILQQSVRSIFSPLNRSVSTPSWMSGSLEINGALSLTLNRLYVILFAALVFLALMAVLKKTDLGLQIRAVAQNRATARALGVRSGWVDALTFGLGAGVAGVAGVALSQLTNVGPNLGQSYIIDSFLVVVFGGVGNLWGTLVGGLTLGVVNKFLEPVAGAVLAKILVLVFIILFIQKRPRGLFPQRGRAGEA